MDDLTIYITWETQLQIEWMDLFVSLNWNQERGREQNKTFLYNCLCDWYDRKFYAYWWNSEWDILENTKLTGSWAIVHIDW